ncbi:MAG TPA: hypothetical protein VFC21_04265 [Bryobacteraceae bacterium]|nr:hypothetical protein [Bryobacteraceae bacterium]
MLTEDDKQWIANALSGALRESEERTAAAIEATETKLLTAFHQWASPLETRVRSHSLAIQAFDGQNENSIDTARKIADLESRVRKLEKAS